MSISAWLHELGLERYVEAFEAHDVDMQTLALLTETDLSEIGVKSVGHRRKLAGAIAALAPGAGAPAPSAPRPAEVPEAANALPGEAMAEHRQLTVLYCDMSDPTGPSSLNAEDMREVIQSFHETCTRVVAEFDGHVANFYGACLLAYFGWPRAHEDDPERAVRAALALIRRIPRLAASSEALSARVGVATGDVVVGDLIHDGPAREQSAVGLTPNLGARLLTLAETGQVVIDELTRQLLPSSFTVLSLGRHVLKGIGEPVDAYAVGGEQLADSRFDARRGQALVPMIGRDQELALLLERWAQARAGEGQAVLLVGEAGLGKSRLTRALLDACAREPHWVVHWQCSPYHTGSALWPVIQRLGRASGLGGDDSNDASLDKLEALIGTDNTEAAALYATLLGLNGTQRYGPLELTPQMLRERTLELLLEQLLEMADERPLQLVVEDAHWIDPSTRELIERCLERVGGARLLILITSRPDNQPELGAHPSVSRLSLNRLSRASVQGIVAQLGGGGLSSQTLATIATQADGVPLFVEELTKAVLETGEATIPASLHGSLMARLDRIAEVKETAQIAACIGREFDRALLQAVAPQPERVAAALDKLAAAELLFRRGDRANPRFTFKHALVQEAAYESLLRGKRRSIHARILQVLEAGDAECPLEIMAHHAARAGEADKAVDYWRQAGEVAQLKSAYHEAAACFSTAIELLDTRPELRDGEREFVMQLRLGQAAMPAFGQTAEITRRALRRAYELLDHSPDPSLRLQVRHGVWVSHWASAEFAQGLRLAQDWLAVASYDPEDPNRQVALRVAGSSYVPMGRLNEARDHLERALVLYEPARHGHLTARLGSETGASACAQLAWTLAMQGSAQRSKALLKRAHELVGAQSSVAAKPIIHTYACQCASILRDTELLERELTQLNHLASRHGLPGWQSYATAYMGWHALLLKRYGEAVEQFARGIADFTATGTRMGVPYFSIGLALSLAAMNRVDEARERVEQAIAECDRTEGRWCEAELWRVKGELLRAGGQRHRSEAVRSFEQALFVARSQGARLWELRASVSLARLWADEGAPSKALALLAPIYDKFAEGFDTSDLVAARSTLGDLSQAAP